MLESLIHHSKASDHPHFEDSPHRTASRIPPFPLDVPTFLTDLAAFGFPYTVVPDPMALDAHDGPSGHVFVFTPGGETYILPYLTVDEGLILNTTHARPYNSHPDSADTALLQTALTHTEAQANALRTLLAKPPITIPGGV